MNIHHKPAAFIRLFASVAGLLLTANTHATTVVGATPGSHQVTPSGAFTYTIPIAVPPGVGGIEPKLSLAYNSQGGNGLLGMGWSLSGFSVIHRCPKTVAQDGTLGGVNYDANDRYCLDGQRLVAVNGAYGADGTEYRTESESYSRIVGYGNQAGSPTWWKVWTKSGQIIEYGNTADSRIEAQGMTAVMLWTLNRLADTVGNYLTVSYIEDNPNGQYYPDRIDYTGNTTANKAPGNSVRFVYETRPDITPTYHAGSLSKLTVRLAYVQSYAGNVMTKDFRLAYGVSGATLRSQLAELTECISGGDCLAPTTFQPTTFEPGLKPESEWANGNPWGGVGWFGFVDLNGDGLTDFWYATAGTSQINVRINQGNAFGPAMEWANNNPWAGSAYIGFVDFNGDGLSDFWYVPSGTTQVRVRLNTGTSFAPATRWADSNPWGGAGWFGFVDLNGDGLTDFWYATAGTSQINVRINQGNAFGPAMEWANNNPWAGSAYIGFVDFNGDGLSDFWYVPSGTTQVRVRLNTGTSFAPATVWANENYWAGVGWFGFEDLNGDGKPDLWFVNPGTSRVMAKLSTGNGFSSEAEWANGNNWAGLGWLGFDDFNGDGKQDFWFVNPGTSRIWVRLSTGTNLAPSVEWANGNYWAGAAWKGFEDFNGDGKKELWFVNPGTSRVLVRLASPAAVDALVGSSNGLGAATTVTYKPLTDASVYAKDSTAVYPYVDLQAPMYVAASVAVSDGTGGEAATHYTYAGAKSHQQGGGFLGFREVAVHDPQARLRSVTTYRQDYPYHGQPIATQKYTESGVLIGQNLITYTDQLIDPSKSPVWRQSLPTRTVESSFELDGSPVSSVTTDTQYDDWGNPTRIAVDSGGGYSKTTTNTYDNIVDDTRWFLGRLRQSTVTSVAP